MTTRSLILPLALFVPALLSIPSPAMAGDRLSRADARQALHRAVRFFSDTVSADGGYLWKYSHDLARREGEGPAGPGTSWVQPPGTPTVGEALLQAWLTCDDPLLKKATLQTGHHLANGQLRSGGWDYRIETEPGARRRYAYRLGVGDPEGRNRTTLDDNTTQSALRFLMHLDRALEFKDARVHAAVEYALQGLSKAQYPNGAWAQRYSEFPDPAKFPVRKAGYPKTWSRTFPKKRYYTFYTFNDNSIADVISTMFEAAEIYGEPRFARAAEKAGDFILLAQMPEPQPAWAQQYDENMHPAWARKFEPPAVTGGESQGIMRTLIFLYRKTGNKKFLNAVPPALDYLKKSQLPDGRLARFYELKTNRPLYFTKKYELVYTDDDLPTHYGFQVGSSLESIEAAYRRAVESGPDKSASKPATRRRPRLTTRIESQARAAIKAMDRRGAWVEAGKLRYHGPDDPTTRIITTRTFGRNLQALALFVAATGKNDQ